MPPTPASLVRGTAIDGSGGVLPGVTVVATAVDGRVLATTVTDAAGGFDFARLADGPVDLTFQLDGFTIEVVRLQIRPGAEFEVVELLKLASLAETVVVHGEAAVDPPPPPPVLMPVPVHDRASVCGPAKAGFPAESFGTIQSRRSSAERGLYAKGDELTIDGGTLNGIDVGRNLVVRRYYRSSRDPGASRQGEHTSGLVQIVAADERVSTAVVVYACDEMMKGDFLASFNPEPVRTPDPAGIPAYEDSARILFADAGQMLGVPRRMMVIDQGSERGIRAGQRLTIFRPARRGAAPPVDAVVGDAVVVAVRPDSATIRVERATDAIRFGDWAAPQHPQGSHGPPPVASSAEAGQLPTP